MRRRFSYRQKQYLVLEAKGLEFIETWFYTQKSIPSSLTKLYQLLLHMVTMKGTVPIYLTRRMGYSSKLIGGAVSRRFVESSLVPKNPADEVTKFIEEVIGKPPQKMFVQKRKNETFKGAPSTKLCRRRGSILND